jgi:hypothetical protein
MYSFSEEYVYFNNFRTLPAFGGRGGFGTVDIKAGTLAGA